MGKWHNRKREHIIAKEKRKELVAEVVKLRQERGLTQKQLEELSGVKQPIIARMETGEKYTANFNDDKVAYTFRKNPCSSTT